MDLRTIVIVLSSIFNLLSCAKLDYSRHTTSTIVAMATTNPTTTSPEFLSSSSTEFVTNQPEVNARNSSAENFVAAKMILSDNSNDFAVPATDDEDARDYMEEFRNNRTVVQSDNDDVGSETQLETKTDLTTESMNSQDDTEESILASGESNSEGEAPQFSQPDNLNRLVPKPSGNMVRIRCAATGNPEPNITWTKDGGEINRSIGKVVTRKWAIILEDLVPKDSGFYTCKLCNVYGCINHTTRLDVKDRFPAKPYILEGNPANITALEYTTVIFNCSIFADIAAHIQWAKYRAFNDSDGFLQPNTVYLETDPDDPEELKLENITHSDEGWYTCIAANSLGTSAASAYLRVVDELDEKPTYAEYKLSPLWGYIIIISMGSLFLVVIFIMLIGFKKLKHEKLQKHRAMETVHQWTKRVIIVRPSGDEVDGHESLQIPVVRIEKQRTTLIQQQSPNDASMFNEYEFPLDSNWEFPRNHLKLGPTLGEGAFGRVIMAEAHGLVKNSQNLIVAVKMVKEGHTDSDMTSLVREMEVMKMIGKHINIINLLGCCSQDGPLYVIVEYAPHGNLKDFLKKNLAMAEYNSMNTQHVLSQKELTSFAYQVARGMEYLASRRCIHRDLAARNVLVCDDYIVKIADFGLARELQESDYYRKSTNGRLPIKWMAPESLKDKFYDSQSDVWSYGILLWEIMTFGEQPYPQIFSSDYLYEYLKEGKRMEKPPRCPINIYALTRQCWNWNPQYRPTFTEIVYTLDNVLTTAVNEEYLELVNVPYLDETSSIRSDEDDDEFHGSSTYDPFLR